MHKHQVIFHHLSVSDALLSFGYIDTIMVTRPREETESLLIEPCAEGDYKLLLCDAREASFALLFHLIDSFSSRLGQSAIVEIGRNDKSRAPRTSVTVD